MGTRTAQGLTAHRARLDPLLPRSDSANTEVRFCKLDKRYKAEVKRITLNIVSLVLETLGQTEAERKYERAPPTAMEREQQTFREDLLKT